MTDPEIGATFAGEALGLATPPSGDLSVVAAEEDVGDRLSFPDLRPRILRVLQETVGKTLLGAGCRSPHDARQEAHASVDQHQSGGLAAREDIVADRDLFERARGDHALVDTLETSADEDDAGAVCERLDAGLSQRRAARRKKEPWAVILGG